MASALTVCIAVTVAIAQPRAVESNEARHRVELVTTDAMRLVFLEHDGPNWAAGAKFARVREYMILHNQPGPMFVLYHRFMPGIKLRKKVSLIGFVAKNAHVPSDPFQVKAIPARQVLRLTVEGKAASPRRLFGKIDGWAVENGHATSDEVLEIYHLAPGAAGRIERTEFQLPLATLRVEAGSTKSKLDDQASDREAPAIDHARPATTKTAPASAPAISVEATTEGEPPDDPMTDSIPALVRAERFDRVAALLLPDLHHIDRDEQVWIGQVIFRIKAAGRGMERKYPKTDDATTALAEALLERYLTVFKARPADPLIVATAASTQGTGPGKAERRAIMRELDGLLGRIAFGTAEPEKVANEVAEHLERARRVLRE